MVDAKTIRKLISAYYALRIELVKADGNPLDALDAADEAVSELEIKIDNYEYAKLRGGKI